MSDRQQKLEAECHRLRLEAEEAWKRVLTAETEIDRLREALERIVERDAYREIVYPAGRYGERSEGPCAEIARTALAKEVGQ